MFLILTLRKMMNMNGVVRYSEIDIMQKTKYLQICKNKHLGRTIRRIRRNIVFYSKVTG